MGIYYPQCSVVLRIRWEDFGEKSDVLTKVYDLPILARRVNVNINDYTQADTFDIEIDYREFPFDPRCIRAVGVTIAMENVKEVFQGDNSLRAIAPRSGDDGNIIFQGFADEESISFDDSKRTVKLEGRDFTALLIDRKYPNGTVNLEQTVDVVIGNILAELEETREIKLDNRIVGALPILSSFWADKDALSGKKNVKKDESYWDVIQDIVTRAGLIAYIELDKLVLSKPRVLYDRAKAISFVYGANLSSLEFKRKIGRKKNFNLIVRSLSIETKEVIEAKIPKEATDEWSKATGINNAEVNLKVLKPDGTPVEEKDEKPAPYLSFRLPNIKSKDHLIKIGQEIYEEIGRQQIEGSFETKEMEICYAEDPDKPQNHTKFNVLKLRNGTAVSIEIDQGDLEGFSRHKSPAAREQHLILKGYEPAVAKALAETYGKFTTPLYIKAVTFSLDESQGFDCKVEFINFIETSKSSVLKDI